MFGFENVFPPPPSITRHFTQRLAELETRQWCSKPRGLMTYLCAAQTASLGATGPRSPLAVAISIPGARLNGAAPELGRLSLEGDTPRPRVSSLMKWSGSRPPQFFENQIPGAQSRESICFDYSAKVCSFSKSGPEMVKSKTLGIANEIGTCGCSRARAP